MLMVYYHHNIVLNHKRKKRVVSKLGKLIVTVIVVILIIAAFVLLYGKKAQAPNYTSNTNGSNNTTSTTNSTQTTPAIIITYADSGFSLSANTMKKGQTVEVINKSTNDMQFDSNPHPTHTDDTELNIGLISPGQSKFFTVTHTGTWGFHNHLQPAQTSSFTVTP